MEGFKSYPVYYKQLRLTVFSFIYYIESQGILWDILLIIIIMVYLFLLNYRSYYKICEINIIE